MQLTGIFRDRHYSPFQHAENDASILQLTGRELEKRGCRVRFLSEGEVDREALDSPVVFSMCQGEQANNVLENLEADGRLIINSPIAVQNCYRVRLVQSAGADCELLAPTVLIPTLGEAALPWRFEEGESFWVKRGDVHATQRGDVVKICSPEELSAVLEDFAVRGIEQAAVQRHIEGEVVKFYGVVGTTFFRYYKEGNFKVCPVAFGGARPAIESLVQRMKLEIYGGDAVITPSGRIYVIDINDWPSFAPFRAEAAVAIGGHIFQRAAAYLASRWTEKQSVRKS
jgi:hypothetical protein